MYAAKALIDCGASYQEIIQRFFVEGKASYIDSNADVIALLQLMALVGDYDEFISLLDFCENALKVEYRRNSLLMLACKGGSFEITMRLIALGENVNKTNIARETPLHFAASNGHTHLIHLLFEYGSDIDATNAKG